MRDRQRERERLFTFQEAYVYVKGSIIVLYITNCFCRLTSHPFQQAHWIPLELYLNWICNVIPCCCLGDHKNDSNVFAARSLNTRREREWDKVLGCVNWVLMVPQCACLHPQRQAHYLMLLAWFPREQVTWNFSSSLIIICTHLEQKCLCSRWVSSMDSEPSHTPWTGNIAETGQTQRK